MLLLYFSSTGEENVEKDSVYTLWRDNTRRLSYGESDMRFHSDGINMFITQRQESRIFILNTANRDFYDKLNINTSGTPIMHTHTHTYTHIQTSSFYFTFIHYKFSQLSRSVEF